MFVDMLHDLRYAIRSLSKRPLFTGVLLLTLALGIGSNVAIFSVANAVLFSPLPYGHPEQLALIWTRLPETNVERTMVSGPDLQDYKDETTLFDGFAGAMALQGTLTGDGPAQQITTGYASWDLFDAKPRSPSPSPVPGGSAYSIAPSRFPNRPTRSIGSSGRRRG